MIIIAKQCIGARAMLGWSRDMLSKAALVAERTLIDFERGARQPRKRTLLVDEDDACVFIDENGGGPGVRLKEPLTK